MQARSRSRSVSRSFTDTARRAQIVTAAIETIADLGYRRASFAQIARRAGLSSTGLISYHFASKGELIGEIVSEVVAAIGAFMAKRMADTAGPREALGAYIEGNCQFTAEHRTEMKALLEIFINGGFEYGTEDERAALSPIEQILVAGQAAREFRDFDINVMASLVQRAIDGLPFLLASQPELDIAAYSREVCNVFDLATRRQQ
jgi:AcrR family transcriptional regulator